MKRKHIYSAALLSFILFLFNIISPVVGLAANKYDDFTYSADQSKTVYGITYVFSSFIQPNNSMVTFGTCITPNSDAGDGYIGLKARCYNTDGALVDYSDWYYTDGEEDQTMHLYTSHDASGYFYSKGQVQLYYGDGYYTYSCTATPNVSPLNSRSILINRNSHNEIYGSELYLNQIGVQPDLVLALGENDALGYVKATDLENNGSGPVWLRYP